MLYQLGKMTSYAFWYAFRHTLWYIKWYKKDDLKFFNILYFSFITFNWLLEVQNLRQYLWLCFFSMTINFSYHSMNNRKKFVHKKTVKDDRCYFTVFYFLNSGPFWKLTIFHGGISFIIPWKVKCNIS